MNEEKIIEAARALLDQEKEEAAGQELRLLPEASRERPEVLALYLRIYLLQADNGGTIEMANRLLDHSPDLIGAQGCFDLAVLFTWLGEMETAEAWLQSAFELDPSERMWQQFCESSDLDEFWVKYGHEWPDLE